MSMTPDGLKFMPSHEWIGKKEGDIYRVGISDHAQNELGSVVYVELPKVGTKVAKGKDVAVVESVKTASDIYAPASGEIVAVNTALDKAPELVNESTYDDGWLFEIKISNPSELDELLDDEAYQDSLSD